VPSLFLLSQVIACDFFVSENILPQGSPQQGAQPSGAVSVYEGVHIGDAAAFDGA
jgi:hypothetical protein